MDAVRVYALLEEARRLLEMAEEYAISALVDHGMAMVGERYGVGGDQIAAEMLGDE